MSNVFKNRVFGCVVIKSLNSNYNADFSHQPRTLPDGTVYATDKALKYTVRNYIGKNKLYQKQNQNETETNYVVGGFSGIIQKRIRKKE